MFAFTPASSGEPSRVTSSAVITAATPFAARRGARIDRADHRMRMRRAQHRGVQRARRHRHVVDVAPAPGEQRGVLHALDRLADPRHPVSSPRHCRATARRETTRRRLILPRAACKIGATGYEMAWMIGVDVGGTFTDFFAFDDTDDRIVLHKVPSTPANPAQAVIAGLRELHPARRRSRRDHPALARHDGCDQRADPAARRQGRAGGHGRLSRPDRDRAADPPEGVRSASGLSGAAGAARAALRGGGAHHGGRQARCARSSRRRSTRW